MIKKILIQFTVLTFLIAFAMCGICLFLGLFGLTLENSGWLWIFIAICAFSPTIASYVVLKKNNEVKGFKEWLWNVFNFKRPVRFYFLVLVFCAVSVIPHIILTGLNEVQSFWMFFIWLPVSLFAGGIEEAGWRYVLQPKLDKQFGLIISSLIVAVIWAIWHIPVLLPQGRLDSMSWFGSFLIAILGWTFALGTIYRITKSVFLCVLFHCLLNALGTTFNISEKLFGNIITTILLILLSVVTVSIYEKMKFKNV